MYSTLIPKPGILSDGESDCLVGELLLAAPTPVPTVTERRFLFVSPDFLLSRSPILISHLQFQTVYCGVFEAGLSLRA